MEILSDPTPDMLAMPRFDDGAIDMQELIKRNNGYFYKRRKSICHSVIHGRLWIRY